MGDAASLHQTADKALEFVGFKSTGHAQQSEMLAPQRRSPTRIDAVMQGVNADIAKATEHTGPETEADQRSNAIERIIGDRGLVIDILTGGTKDGLALLATPDKVPASVPTILLDVAVSTLISGSASGIAAKVATVIASKADHKAAEYALKEALKTVGKAVVGTHTGAGDTTARADLVNTFSSRIDDQIRDAKSYLVDHPVSALLSRLPTADLVQLAQHLHDHREANQQALKEGVKTSTVVAWANFLAQARHGAMGSWDLWERNGGRGAVQLDGAAPAPTSPDAAHEVTAGNVPQRAMREMIDVGDATGVLEIAMTLGRAPLADFHGGGMRLANIGPKVRAHMRTLHSVRDVPINKLIRLYDVKHAGSTEVVQEIGSILITADGYVRNYNLGREMRVHSDTRPTTLREIAGIDHRQWRIHQEANEALVREIAESAQALPMSKLEG